MPPRTRASTPSTPSPRKQATATTPRKTPCCSQCQRPRAGHPRQGCPFVDSSPAKEDNILEDIGAMKLSDRSEEDKAIIRDRRRSSSPRKIVRYQDFSLPSLESLDSICSEDKRTLTNIPKSKQEDSGDETETEDDKCRIRNWRSSLPSGNGSKRYPHSGMPGTLETPTSSFNSDSDPAVKDEPAISEVAAQDIRPRRVARSQSWEDREAFLQTAAEASVAAPASLYTFSTEDVASYLEGATRRGIFVKTLPTEDTNEVAVVMGRDEKAVVSLYNAIKAMHTNTKSSAAGRSGFKAAAGGLVVGAVATFTSLAFS